MQETRVQSLGCDDPLKEMTTHSGILAWEIPWSEEPVGYKEPMGSPSPTQLSDYHFTSPVKMSFKTKVR